MKKCDLKSGHVIELANGDKGIICEDLIIFDNGCFDTLERWTEDLNVIYDTISECNIVKVYKYKNKMSLKRIVEKDNLELIWNRKDIIINIVAPSGAGKTTLAKLLELDKYNIIHSYTTRLPREENEWGHIFIDLEEFEDLKSKDMIAYCHYNKNHYFATREQYKNKGVSIYIVDPKGAKMVKDSLSDDDNVDVYTVFLYTDENTRANRMAHEGRDIDSIKERLAGDREVFKYCECDLFVDGGRDIESVYLDVSDFIKRVQNL